MKPMNNAPGLSGKTFPVIGLFCSLLLLVFSACNLYESAENKSSDKAKKEEAAMYIDKGDYDKALDILNKLYNKNPDTTDAKLLQLLSNASSGSIGIDTFSILEVADEIIDSGDDGIELAGRVLGDEDGYLDRNTIRNNLITLGDSSIFYLEQIPEKTEDHYAQLGLLSLIDTVMIVGDMILEQKKDEGVEKIKLTEEGIKELYADGYTDLPQSLFEKHEQRLNDNVQRMDDSVAAILSLSGGMLPEDNDFAEIFDDFLKEITDPQDGTITETTLNSYISNLAS